MAKLVLLLALFCSFSQIIPDASAEVVICYHGTWAHYRNGNGQFRLPHLAKSAKYCTHWVYTFMGINTNGSMISLDTWLDLSLDNLKQYNIIKKSSECSVKTLLAIGGWNEGSSKFSTVMANPSLRAIFVKSVLYWVQTYGFDGFDLDWEYPAQRGGSTTDKENFNCLVRELRAAFDPYGLILTAAVPATGSSVDLSYDVATITQYLDYVNIMTYDLHGSWDSTTGHNAPLFASPIDTDTTLNVAASIQAWIARGAPASKLVVGLPVYGRTYTLSSSTNTALGAPISGAGAAGPHTQTAGFLGYNEILERFAEGGWTIIQDNTMKVPYAFKGNQWIGFDDPQAIAAKVNYSFANRLGGVMLWSIETDDFAGIYGDAYPILGAIKSAYTALGVSIQENCNSASPGGSSSSSSGGSSSTGGSSSSGGNASSGGSSSSNSDPFDKDNDSSNPEETPIDESADSASNKNTDNSNSSSGNSSNPSSRVVTSNVSGAYQITCPDTGYYRESSNCGVFYQCSAAGVKVNGQSCHSSLVFDLSSNNCNWPSLVPDCSN